MLGDPYATLADLKAYLKLQTASQDGVLTDALTSASDEIEKFCSRTFNKTPTPSRRLFVPDSLWEVSVDDIASTTGLVVEVDNGGVGGFETTIPATQYELSPPDGVVDGQPGWPYNHLYTAGGVWLPRYWYGRRRASVRVTAQWGWPAVPASIKRACLLMASQSYKLAEAPFGVAGSDQFGAVRIRDLPQVRSKLQHYVRDPVQVG